MAFFAFPYHLPCSQFQVFSFLTGNKFVPACWIAPVLLIHSELLHLCVHPSREPDALRVPHPPLLTDPYPKYVPTKVPCRQRHPIPACSPQGFVFYLPRCSGGFTASSAAAREKGRPAQGSWWEKEITHWEHPNKNEQKHFTQEREWFRDQADSIRLRSWGFCSHPHSCHSHWFATDRLLGNSIILLLKLDNDIII